MTLDVLQQWIALVKEWQSLLAGMLVVLASMIFATGIVRAAKISAANRQKPGAQDLRISMARDSVDTNTFESVSGHLDKLRSLLRSALASLSFRDADDETTRSLCTRIAAYQWKRFPIPVHADKRMRETYATFLNQFEMLQGVLDKEWSPSEASPILIQMNANARILATMFKQMESGRTEAPNPKRRADVANRSV